MSATDYSSSWLDSKGVAVEIPDSFDDMVEYFSSILKASQMANVESKLEGFGHEDVTLVIDSETDGDVRMVQFTIVINNWEDHVGGESSYSRQDMVEYVDPENTDELDELMYSNGAFFHKLENKTSDIFHRTDFNRPMFSLEDADADSVCYSGSVNMHRYDQS